MIKLFATSITVLSGISFGTLICKGEKEEIENLEELLKLVSFILWNVEHRSAPLYEIFDTYFSETNSVFSSKLRETRGKFGDKLLRVSGEICQKETVNELKSFFLTLGKTDRETQIKTAREAIASLEKALSEKKKEYAEKIKLYRILPFLVSCVVAVLLY